MKKIALFVAIMLTTAGLNSFAADESVAELKKQILNLAKSFEGQADLDQSKQKRLDVLVKQLVKKSPMAPIRNRISTLAGTWKQVWGPYDYRNDNGGIDPKLGLKEIYQVVFAGGYYYNVAPYYPEENKKREQIGLLRGEFTVDGAQANVLNVKFTDYPGVEPRPRNMNIWELAPIAEAGQLQNEVTIVPSWVVRSFFNGGKLDEVYTDEDLRLVYGSKQAAGSRRFLYVMTRVK